MRLPAAILILVHAVRHHYRTLVAIGCWYVISLTLTGSNKLLLDLLQFRYPVFTTFIHFAGVGVVLKSLSYFKPSRSGHRKPSQPLNKFVKYFLPISIFSALEVALTNQAYSLVSLPVLTVVKSTLVVATYFVSILFRLETFNWQLAAVLGWIIVNVSISLPGMYMHSYWGVLVLFLAVGAASIRWVLIHLQIQVHKIPIEELIAITQPLAAVCLVPAVIMYDGAYYLQNGDGVPAPHPHDGLLATYINAMDRVVLISTLLIVSTVLVTILLYVEFQVVEDSSSLSLVVAGTGKECLTVLMSLTIFNESIHVRGWFGLINSVCGIIAYAYLRAAREVADARNPEEKLAADIEMQAQYGEDRIAVITTASDDEMDDCH